MDINNTVFLVGFLLIVAVIIVVGFFYYNARNKGKYEQEFWENGSIKHKYFYKNKVGKCGKEIFFYRNGKVNKKRQWKNNQLNGKSVVFYSTGEKYIETNYKKGKYEGKYTVFEKNGVILKQYLYKDGLNISEDNNLRKVEPKSNLPLVRELSLETDDTIKSFKQAKSNYESIKKLEETKDNDKNELGFLSGLKKVSKVATGIQGYQDRESTKNIKECCEIYYNTACEITEDKRKKLNINIEAFGKNRVDTLHKTIGRFLGLLKDMQQENKIKEYEVLGEIGLDTQSIEKMERVDMAASKALTSTATVGALGTAAAMGTPALVTSAVGALATASTGTAISSLSGVAATNATLAWLGGGSIAAGGGGMAAGATVLTSITAGATAGVGLLAAGLLASTHYSRKLTEAKEYQAVIETEVANMEKLWVLLEGIHKRTAELNFVTLKLEEIILYQLDFLEPLTINYDTSDRYYNSIFQESGLLIKSMSELAQTPLLDNEGAVSSESARIVTNTYTILNKELTNNG
ncbi:toxin-antitoxin system YwqK family antitoxin [Acinetobacter guillouiae]|uniref:toxin-antitoxin system YwqK family antitoxin n=1 Tax=Acinetobacter guillouiae TaxID=106649 RepID=UPI003AF91D76